MRAKRARELTTDPDEFPAVVGSRRLHYLDSLRAAAVLLVVLLPTLISYTGVWPHRGTASQLPHAGHRGCEKWSKGLVKHG